MSYQTFGAIYIGSYEMSLKVFELTPKKKMKEIDHLRKRLDLGRDVYKDGIIGYEMVDEICDTLNEFALIMKGYKVDNSEVYASAVLRDAENSLFVINQIFIRTCFRVKVLSNSEFRFVSYKSVAGREQFEEMIQTSAAVVDIGGSGIQITLFAEGKLVNTQHMELGTVKLRELFGNPGVTQERYLTQVEEYIGKKIEVFRSIYLSQNVETVILVNDYSEEIVRGMRGKFKEDEVIHSQKLMEYVTKLLNKSLSEVCKELKLSNDQDPLILPTMVMINAMLKSLGAEYVWVPGVNINDGIAYDFSERHDLVKSFHDFDEDVISAANYMSRHYNSYSPHIEALEKLSVQVYDTMKKIHGLGERERLLLRVAVILHDCGKYITLSNSSKSSYEIIMASEIIGLSHREREMVALSVFFNDNALEEFEDMTAELNEKEYLAVCKLSAILRLANALDQSHKQKFDDIKISIKERNLVISIESMEDVSLETALFEKKTGFFERIFSMKPVLKEKRV